MSIVGVELRRKQEKASELTTPTVKFSDDKSAVTLKPFETGLRYVRIPALAAPGEYEAKLRLERAPVVAGEAPSVVEVTRTLFVRRSELCAFLVVFTGVAFAGLFRWVRGTLRSRILWRDRLAVAMTRLPAPNALDETESRVSKQVRDSAVEVALVIEGRSVASPDGAAGKPDPDAEVTRFEARTCS